MRRTLGLVLALFVVVLGSCGQRRQAKNTGEEPGAPPVASSGAPLTDAAPPAASVPCGSSTCGPNEYCENKCTCCGMMTSAKPSGVSTCRPIPAGCTAASFCACAGVHGLCSDKERSISIPCA